MKNGEPLFLVKKIYSHTGSLPKKNGIQMIYELGKRAKIAVLVLGFVPEGDDTGFNLEERLRDLGYVKAPFIGSHEVTKMPAPPIAQLPSPAPSADPVQSALGGAVSTFDRIAKEGQRVRVIDCDLNQKNEFWRPLIGTEALATLDGDDDHFAVALPGHAIPTRGVQRGRFEFIPSV